MSERERFVRTLFGGGAKSSCGYKVYFNNRSSIEYVEGDQKIFVGAEALQGRMAMAVFPEQIAIGKRDGPQLEDRDRRDFIVERVRRAAQFLGWNLE